MDNKYTASIPNIESFQVRMIECDGTNIDKISNFIKQYGIKSQSIVTSKNGVTHIVYAQPWHKADEEQPQKGDKYCIHPDKQCYIYTAGEFEANFKAIPE